MELEAKSYMDVRRKSDSAELFYSTSDFIDECKATSTQLTRAKYLEVSDGSLSYISSEDASKIANASYRENMNVAKKVSDLARQAQALNTTITAHDFSPIDFPVLDGTGIQASEQAQWSGLPLIFGRREAKTDASFRTVRIIEKTIEDVEAAQTKAQLFQDAYTIPHPPRHPPKQSVGCCEVVIVIGMIALAVLFAALKEMENDKPSYRY